MNRSLIGVIVTLALSLLVVPLTAEAQPVTKVPRIGVLSLLSSTRSATSPFWEAFQQTLREMGYVEGQNIAFEFRYAERQVNRLPALAAELVHLNVDVIVVGETPAIHAAMQATTIIPIVLLTVGDPVEAGFVKSLAQPGGNVTGVGGLVNELNRKLLELLTEAVPGVTRIAVFGVPENLARAGTELEATAQGLGVQLQLLTVRGADEFASAFNAATSEGAGALLILPAPLFALHERRIAALAVESRLPAIFWRRFFAEAGGLMAYGPSLADNWRRAARLRGQDPARRQAGRPAGGAAHEVRVGHQPQDRQGAWDDDAAVAALPGGRSAPVADHLAVAFRGKPTLLTSRQRLGKKSHDIERVA